MKNEELFKYIDHTLLKPFSTWIEIEKLCDEAIKYKTASVCIPPSFVKKAKDKFGSSLKICTVIGFPLGYSTTATKIAEAKNAISDGADEIDMVINIGYAKEGLFNDITNEITLVKKTANDKILKVIIETCYLTTDEKIALCKCVTDSGADYIKTSTGFGTSGATLEDIQLFKKHIGSQVKIKAAGGVKTKSDLEMFVAAGCSRIGTSSAVDLLQGDICETDKY